MKDEPPLLDYAKPRRPARMTRREWLETLVAFAVAFVMVILLVALAFLLDGGLPRR